MKHEDTNTLERVGDGEDDSDPGQGTVEIEESEQPTDAEDADQGHATLHLSDEFLFRVEIIISADCSPRNIHGHDEDDDVDDDDNEDWSHEGPNEVIVEPAVIYHRGQNCRGHCY